MAWSASVESSLQGLWESAPDRAWASFDFDNTIIHGDISEALLGTQIANGLIPEATLRTFPDLQHNGSLVVAGNDPARYYEAVFRSSTLGGVDYGNYPGAVWLAQVMVGTSLEDFIERLAPVCGQTTDGFQPQTPSQIGGFDVPVLRGPVVDLIGNLITHGVRVRIISAGLVWAVRWYVSTIINPLLAARFGAGIAIELADVMGIGSCLLDRQSKAVTSDRMLLEDVDYLALSPSRTTELELTALIDGPLTFAEGKIAGAKERFGTKPPYLVVGDSLGDLALWNFTQHRLWLRKPDSAANATLMARLEQPYLVQDVA